MEIITIDQKKQWDEIIKSFSNYNPHFLSDYVKAFENTGDGTPFLFYYSDNGTRAINVMFKRSINSLDIFSQNVEKCYDLISPYGYGGFIIEGNDYLKVLESYNNYCKSNNIVSEFVRFNLFEGFEKKYDGEVIEISNNVIVTIDKEPEIMLREFEHRVRKNIRKATDSGLSVERVKEGKLDEFLKVYYHTMSRNSASDSFYFKKEFFEEMNKMDNNVIYFNTLKDNEVISTELVIYDNNVCYSYLGGTNSDYYPFRPNEILKFEIIKWAYENNIKYFVLGGGHGCDDGIFMYKKGFAPNGIVKFYVGRKIFNQELYNKLVDINEKKLERNIESSFFPKYRCLEKSKD